MGEVDIAETAKYVFVRLCQGGTGPCPSHSSAPIEREPTRLRRFYQEVDRPILGLMYETDGRVAHRAGSLK